MNITKFRAFLLEKGMVRIYSFFLLGWFALPMSGTLQKTFFFLVLPATLMLTRELIDFYRGNRLFQLIAAFHLYMLTTLLWTADFETREAAEILWYTINQFAFICISGYLWVRHPETFGKVLYILVWLSGIVAVASILAWYSANPFPSSRLEPLGVIHHPNKAACAYGLVLLLVVQYLFSNRGRNSRLAYSLLCLTLTSLVLLTQSRTGLAAVSVGAVLLFGYRAMIAVAIAIAISTALVAASPDIFWFRVGALSYRPEIWLQTIKEMQGHWLFGHGILMDEQIKAGKYSFSHTHNSYLATLRDSGIIGLSLLAAIFALGLKWALGLYTAQKERVYLALVLFGMTCIAMDFDRLFTKPKEQWLFLWLPLALVMAVYPRRESLPTQRQGLYSA